MKRLYLLRHAMAGRDDSGAGDFRRSLSPRGMGDAAAMGRALAGRDVRPEAVFSSPSFRTRETLEIIAPLMGFPFGEVRFRDLLYLAPREDLVSFIRGLDDRWDRVFLCGHNPGLEEAGAFFLRGGTGGFPPCSFREIGFAADSWRGAGPETAKGKAFLTPGMLEPGRVPGIR